jgi:hypothetical protein
MDAQGIKAFMALRNEGPSDIAKAISTPEQKEHLSDVSRVLNYERPNERIRRKIAKYWNIPYEELWDADREKVAATG